MASKIPVTVITGFLGSGKTTLMCRLLNSAEAGRVCVLVNEFGDVGVDGTLIGGCKDSGCAAELQEVVELANGCICCTVAEDFLPVMQRILDREDPPDRILIETSGLALPQPLIRAFGWPEIRTRVFLDGVVLLVDAAALSEGRFAQDEEAVAVQAMGDSSLEHLTPLQELFEDQLASADLVLLNKMDLVPEEKRIGIEENLRSRMPPGSKLIKGVAHEIGLQGLFGVYGDQERDFENCYARHEQSVEPHDHDDFVTLVVEPPVFASRETFVSRLQALLKNHALLRVKGFVALEGVAARLAVQVVGARVEVYFDRPWQDVEQSTPYLVVIGEKGLDQDAVRAFLME